MKLMQKCLSVLTTVILVITISCTGEKEEGEAETPAEDPRTELTLTMPGDGAEVQEKPDGNGDVSEEADGNQPSSPTRPARPAQEVTRPELIPLSTQEKLAGRKKVSPVNPEDMSIGRLYTGADEDETAEEAKAAEVVFDFLATLMPGQKNGEYFSAESKDYLMRLMELLDEGRSYPESYRLGTVEIEDAGEARANIRLIGDPGRGSGEILLVLEEGNWRITDLQISFEELSKEYIKNYEAFEPRVYRWLELY